MAPPADRLRVAMSILTCPVRQAGARSSSCMGSPARPDAPFLQSLSREPPSWRRPSGLRASSAAISRPSTTSSTLPRAHRPPRDDKVTLVGASFAAGSRRNRRSCPRWLDASCSSTRWTQAQRSETPDILDVFNTTPTLFGGAAARSRP